MPKEAGISSACPNADYTKPVIDADLVEWFQIENLTIDECRDIAAGIVPNSVRVSAMALLDFEDLIRRNAQKPVRQSKTRKKASA
jgi:hypothetical protein